MPVVNLIDFYLVLHGQGTKYKLELDLTNQSEATVGNDSNT